MLWNFDPSHEKIKTVFHGLGNNVWAKFSSWLQVKIVENGHLQLYNYDKKKEGEGESFKTHCYFPQRKHPEYENLGVHTAEPQI